MDNNIVNQQHERSEPYDWREDSPFLGTLAFMLEDVIESVRDMTIEDVVLGVAVVVFMFCLAALS